MNEKIQKAREAFELLNAQIDCYHTYLHAETEALYVYETALRRERQRYLRVLEGDSSIDERVTTTDFMRARRDLAEARAMSKAMHEKASEAVTRFDEAILAATEGLE